MARGNNDEISDELAVPENNTVQREPTVYYSILTLEWSQQIHPERRQNVEKIEREFPQFVRDIAIDATTEYEEINRFFKRHNVTCDTRIPMALSLGNHGLWASTLRRWERLIEEQEKWDFAVIVQDDHVYDEAMHAKITTMVSNRWKYFRGEISLPMYSFGHGDGINLYTVSALPGLITAFQDNFHRHHLDNKIQPLDVFYDRLGLASENANFAWSKILDTHENSTIQKINLRTDGYDITCSPEGKLERVERDPTIA